MLRTISLLKLSSEELSATVAEILKITGKSIMTVRTNDGAGNRA